MAEGMRRVLPLVPEAGPPQDQMLVLPEVGRIKRGAGDPPRMTTTVAKVRKLPDEDSLPLVRATLDELLR